MSLSSLPIETTTSSPSRTIQVNSTEATTTRPMYRSCSFGNGFIGARASCGRNLFREAQPRPADLAVAEVKPTRQRQHRQRQPPQAGQRRQLAFGQPLRAEVHQVHADQVGKEGQQQAA